MAFGSFETGDDIEANAEINMVPFIDVMLVLLIIFMITAPLMSHAVKVDLPKASSQVLASAIKPVDIAVLENGEIRINEQVVAIASLGAQLKQYSAETEVHLRADRKTPYEVIARIMAAASNAGLSRIGFVTEQPD